MKTTMMDESLVRETNASPKVNILMVDDQPAKLLSYETILAELDENLISATSGRQALDLLLKHEIAVILMDVSMPDLNGFELAEMIHQHPRYQKTAIIFISGVHLTDVDRIKGYQRGAMDYISVPVVPELLRAKVGVFAELYRKTRDLQNLNAELERRVDERTAELEKSSRKVRDLNGQLQQRLAELETIMKVLPVGVSVAQDPECQVITGNAALYTMLGMQPGQNVSLNGDGIRPHYRIYQNGQPLAADDLPVQQACRTGEPADGVEIEIRRNDGKVALALSSANPLFDDSGNVRGAVGAMIDITHRKQMEQTLKERADLMDLASEAIIVRNLDGTIRFWNSGATALYGWSAEEAIGSNLHDLLQTKFPVAPQEINSVLSSGKLWEGNLVQVTREGHEVIIACRKSLQLDPERSAVLEICRDITAQLQAEEALRRSEKFAAMGRMAGIVAHEINNPLNAITNVFYLLGVHPSLDDEAKKYAEMAQEEISRISHITRQTLAFYRESAQAIPVSIPSILDETLELQQPIIHKNNIELRRKYTGDAVVQAFPGELKQVFLNLIGNAIEAMPGGGVLRVQVRGRSDAHSRSDVVRVSITDTGTGISSKDSKRLFEPFFSTKLSKGTGLGLWISKGIVQKYDGSIRFRTTRLPGGNVTCFSVVIPSSSPSDRMHAKGSRTESAS
jgi:PAS domain S-box-containing protein